MSSSSSAPVNNVETSEGGETTSSSSRFAQFQSSFYRKTSFAPKIKKKGVVKKDGDEKLKETDKGTSVTDSEKDIER